MLKIFGSIDAWARQEEIEFLGRKVESLIIERTTFLFFASAGGTQNI